MYIYIYILLNHPTIPYIKIQNSDYTKDCDTAFTQLKHILVHTSILAMPNFDAIFVVEIDVSGMIVGELWMQHDWPSFMHVKSVQLCTMELLYYGL